MEIPKGFSPNALCIKCKQPVKLPALSGKVECVWCDSGIRGRDGN